MRILIVGDTHGSVDMEKLSPQVVRELNLNQNDVIIHCGDIGVPWIWESDEMLKYWSNLPCDVIVCLGNHENYNWIEKRPIVKKYGVMGYEMAQNLFAPLIGSIATIFNKTFWFYPGGYSIDFSYRELDSTIFKQELPLKEKSDQALTNLFDYGPVDVIISHDGPRTFILEHFGYPIGNISDSYLEKTQQQKNDRVHPGFVLDEVYNHPELYEYWFFGHHHKDFVDGKIRCLMKKMVLWDVDKEMMDIVS